MKIENIHIDGFGVWNDRTWENLEPGLNVFHGPNETGKSTMMAFIRALLFGFDKKSSARRYEPLNGGAYGGWLDVRVDARPLRIDRKAGRHTRGAVTIYDGDKTGGDPELETLLGGTTRTLFHNVFAFGLEELEQFHTLQETEISQHISGAGLGIGASKWTAVLKDLDARQSSLFLPRGHNASINVAFKELDAVREDLDRTEHQPEEYWAAHEARTRLAAEVAGLEEVVADLKQRTAQFERRLKSRPLMERRKAIEKSLADLPVVEQFPEGGLERLILLRRQLQLLQQQMDSCRREAEQRRKRRMDLKSQLDPGEYERRIQVVEFLRNLMPRTEAIRRVYTASMDRLNAIEHEHAAHEAAVTGVRPPSQLAVFLFVGLIWCGAAGIALSGHLYSALGLIAVSLSPYWWYKRRTAGFKALRLKLDDCIQRRNASRSEVRQVEDEAREVEAEIRRLTGKGDIAEEEIAARVAEIERLAKIAEQLRQVEESVQRSEEDQQRIGTQIREQNAALAALFGEASTATEKEFLACGDVWKQRQQLLSELDRIPLEAVEPAMLFELHDDEQEAFERTVLDLVTMEQRLADIRHESGRVEERIVTMERSEERARLLGRQEMILSKLDANAEQWAVLTLCKVLLDETRKIYENERQPEVLRQASLFYKTMTDGRYCRVIAPLDGAEIQVERADGLRLSPQVLSRGAAEQLYLAMRLALVREYATRVDPLPVVFDDVFVNFDPQRARQTLEAVQELARTHQVLLFTCHPHLVEMVSEIVPAARIFPLQ